MKKLFFIAVFLVIAQNSFAENFINHYLKFDTKTFTQKVAKILQDPEVKPFAYGATCASICSAGFGGYCQFTDQCSESSPAHVLLCTCLAATGLFVVNGLNTWIENINKTKNN